MPPAELTLVRRLLVSHAGVALIIALSSITSTVALHTARHNDQRADDIVARLALLEHLRTDAREVARTARQYTITGSSSDQQRLLAIEAEMDRELTRLGTFKQALMQPIDDYIGTIHRSLPSPSDAGMAAAATFEPILANARQPLRRAFDAVAARGRADREQLIEARRLASYAQAGTVVAGALGLMLVGGSILSVFQLRRVRARAERPGPRAVSGEIALGPIGLRRESSDLTAMLDRAIGRCRDRMAQRQLSIRFDPQAPLSVHADRELLEATLESLVALIATSARVGTTLVVLVKPDSGRVRVAFEIEGGTVFEPTMVPFADASLHRSLRAIEAHGGELGVVTALTGVSFWLSLPTEPAMLA